MNVRIHKEALPEHLARAVLNVPTEGPHSSVGHRLHAAVTELAVAVAAANKELAGNPLVRIVAEHAMREIGKRGSPRIVVDPSGEVMLVVSYDPATEEDAPPPAPRRKSTMPSIQVLRDEARAQGLDWEPFGKNKTRLQDAIRKAQAVPLSPPAVPAAAPPPPPVAPPPPPPAPAPAKHFKTTPPVPVHIVPQGEDDLDALFRDKAPPPAPVEPVRRPPPATVPEGPPKMLKGRSLSAIAGNAEAEVDIDTILAKPPAAPPPSDE